MSRQSGGDRDLRFETALGRVLRIGVVASSICLAGGLLLTLFGPGGGPQPQLLTAGLVLLLATPVMRVVVSAATYVLRRDWIFATLTLVVLLELIASVFAAFRH